jgi:hypothetical protein
MRRAAMNAKLIPNLEEATIERPKPAGEKLTGIVAELAGALKDADVQEPRTEYTGYLMKKYSLNEDRVDFSRGEGR